MVKFRAISVRTPSSSRISKVEIEPKPFGKGNRGFKYVYHITFDNLEPGQLAVLDAFVIQLLELLTQWSIEEIVEVKIEVTNLDGYLREYVTERCLMPPFAGRILAGDGEAAP